MKKIVIGLVLVVIAGGLVWYFMQPREVFYRSQNEPPPPSQAAPPPPEEVDDALNITFEHFFKTLSKSEQDCFVSSIGSARIQAWIKDPAVEPTTEEQAKMDACLSGGGSSQ